GRDWGYWTIRQLQVEKQELFTNGVARKI
ncbi:phage tail protein, partial [Vibrio vulnificus]